MILEQIKKLPTNKSPDLDSLSGKFYKAFKKDLISIFSNSSKKLKRMETFQTRFKSALL